MNSYNKILIKVALRQWFNNEIQDSINGSAIEFAVMRTKEYIELVNEIDSLPDTF